MPQLAYILMNAELSGLICSGPLNGKQHTYAALLDERGHRQAGGRSLEAHSVVGED